MIKEDIRYASSAVLEGMISVRALLSGIESGVNNRRIEKILYTGNADLKAIGYLRAVSGKYGYTVEETESVDEYTVGSSHGGIIAFCSERNLPECTPEILNRYRFTVMIDGIEDPYNFGYALRSVYAAGADAILLRKRNWMSAAGVVARSSAGASEMLPVYTVTDDFISSLPQSGINIYIADEKAENDLYTTSFELPALLIAGGEKRGVSKDIKDLDAKRFSISYARDFKASLSAASAVTVSAFEIYRQNPDNLKQTTSPEEIK